MVPLPPRAKKTLTGFRSILASEGLIPSQCLAIGDHPIEDVQNAQELGIASFLVRWFVQPEVGNVEPDAVFERPEELLDLLRSAA